MLARDIEMFIEHCGLKGLSTKTVNSYEQTLRLFMQYMDEQGILLTEKITHSARQVGTLNRRMPPSTASTSMARRRTFRCRASAWSRCMPMRTSCLRAGEVLASILPALEGRTAGCT